MRLTQFTVNNYRSIVSAEKLDLADLTVLIGPNNEGKSNILRALVLGMRVLERAARGDERVRSRVANSLRRAVAEEYSWDRDYPIQLQEENPEGRTSLRYNFELTDDERDRLREALGSKINNELPINLQLGPKRVQMSVVKQGKGKQTLQQQRDVIAEFIGTNLDVTYIPAVRQSNSSEEAVRRILTREIRDLEQSEEYQSLVQKIEDLQQPMLERVGVALANTLVDFVPEVQSVKLAIDDRERFRALRQSLNVIVDDGFPTDPSTKGDGIQSLAAVAITKYFSEQVGKAREFILAIEEPESHLHPNAVHQLRRVLTEMAKNQQIVISTHSPIFASRIRPSDNIIVRENKARAAGGIQEIRNALGVRVADNLRSASHMIVVEGRSDKRIIQALTIARSPSLEEALRSGRVAIQPLGGASKLQYGLGRLRADVCDAFVVFDNDLPGRNAVRRAVNDSLIDQRQTFLLSVRRRSESELEDLIAPNIYCDGLADLGLHLPDNFMSGRNKWSDRMAGVASDSGKDWSDGLQRQAKCVVADSVENNPGSAVHGGASTLVSNLVEELNRWVSTLTLRSGGGQRTPGGMR